MSRRPGRVEDSERELLHEDLPDRCLDLALRHVAVSHDLAETSSVSGLGVLLDVVVHFGLDRLGEQPLRALPEDLREEVPDCGPWNCEGVSITLTHQAYPFLLFV